ncbi:MAG: choice-of-anchor D domain-containing protein, partial [Planctomycetes bacterium]|nr:choice-of-anchor D domain-containing protein [Planctomycetota bacterium]
VTQNPYEGTYSAKSGLIYHNDESELFLQLEVTTAGTISFYRKVSSESSYDYLNFYVDGIRQEQWSGEVAWGQVSYQVSPGNHTFKWAYEKDYSVNNGSDAGWIDYIIFPSVAIAAPDIAVSTLALDFGAVFIGQQETEILTVTNTGSVPLAVTNISSNQPAFSVNITDFVLNQNESQNVQVTFTPNTAGNFNGILTISSNDPDESPANVNLQGQGLNPASFTVTPTQLSQMLESGLTSNQLISINNTGGIGLNIDISIDEIITAVRTDQVSPTPANMAITRIASLSEVPKSSKNKTNNDDFADNTRQTKKGQGGNIASDPDWLSVDPLSIFISAGAVAEVQVTFDATMLAMGTYNAEITLANSLYQLEQIVPVELQVFEDPPAGPTDLNVTSFSSTQIDLSWADNSDNETGFRIERRPGSGGDFMEIGATGMNVTFYEDDQVSPDQEYCYRICAYNLSGNSDYTDIECATATDIPVPADPTDLEVEPVSDAQIDLNWTDNANNEEGFAIERQESSNRAFVQIATVEPDLTTYQDTGLIAETNYCYRLRAFNSGGNSAYTDVECAATFSFLPAAPTDLTAMTESTTRISLTWIDNSNNEEGFAIERQESTSRAFILIATVDPDLTTYEDENLVPGSEYCYRIRAFNANGNSAYSQVQCATTISNPPDAPTDLSVQAVSDEQIDVSWTDNANNETGFRIERRLGASGNFIWIGTAGPNLTTYEDQAVFPDQEFCYRVLAFNGGGNSDYSNLACVTTSNLPPIALDQELETPEDIALTIILSGSDPEQAQISYEILESPQFGILSGTPPIVIYTPDQDYFGPDQFTYCVNDGFQDSEPATISLTISPVNDEPTLTIIEPDGIEDIAHESFVVLWIAEDVDDNAQFSFYVDNNGQGFDGYQISPDFFEDDSDNEWLWETSDLPEGIYFLYTLIVDDEATISTYAPGPVTIVHRSPGDLDGDYFVTDADLVLLIKYILGYFAPNPIDAYVADVNGDGLLNAADIIRMIDMISGD